MNEMRRGRIEYDCLALNRCRAEKNEEPGSFSLRLGGSA
jgi:hypothetical protein